MHPIPAFFLALLAVSVAQAQVTCSTLSQPTTVRAEGLSELTGDVLLACLGGTPPSSGAALPTFDLIVSMNTNITSRLLNGSISEALLFVDDPAPAAQLPCAPSNGSTVCGPFQQGNSVPNVFQGVRQSDNAIAFRSIPISPPGSFSNRLFRIKLLRAAVAGSSVANGQVAATVSLQNAPPGLSLDSATAIVGFVQTGMVTAARNDAGNAAYSAQSLVRCTDWNAGLAGSSGATYTNNRSLVLRFSEGYAAAFRPRDVNAPFANPPTLQQSDPSQFLGASFVSTESGFFNTLFPATNGLNRAGRADHGTRLRAVFTGVPANVRVFVSAHSLRSATYSCVSGRCEGGGSSSTAAAYGIVSEALANPLSGAETWNNGSGDPRALPTVSPAFPSGARAGLIEVPMTAGSGSFTWEVFDQSPLAVESLSFAVAFAISSGTPAGSGSIQVSGGFAPASTINTMNDGAAIPRFADSPGAVGAVTIADAGCPSSLTQLSPSAVDAGSPAFPLQVSGSAFTPQSVVLWNGSSRPTTFVSSTSLTATIAAADVAQAGTALVSVSDGISSQSSTLTFTIRGTTAFAVTLVSPANNATNVPTSVTLAWTATGATSYEYYLGTTPTPPLAGTTTTTNVAVSGLLPGTVYYWRVIGRTLFASVSSATFQFTTGGASVTSGYQFIPVTPCRLLDTRTTGSPIQAGATIDLQVPTRGCGIPATAKAYALNVTVVPSGGLSYLTLWPSGLAQPFVSTLNSFHGGVVSNAAIVPAGFNGAVSFFATDRTDVIVDINGYFDSTGGSSFYAVDPCRAADTRTGSGFTGLFGAPQPNGSAARSYPLPSSACALPIGATAYSLNVTAVPVGGLSYLTAWPTGQPQPLVSTLNSFDGSVVANAAIVPAGTSGSVNVFVTDPADTILDVNGYFAAPGGPGAMQFYPVTPCRVADTRSAGGILTAGSTRDFAVAGTCGVPSTARAYSVNVTAVPSGGLSYLTLWPAGKARPFVSTLNSFRGRILANAALVPAGTSGAVSVFVTDSTHVILDVNGYFQ